MAASRHDRLLAQPGVTSVIWFGHKITCGLDDVGMTQEPPDLVVEDHFAIVPEWLLDAYVSEAAIWLCAVLLRYGQTSGARMPSRSALARRMHKRSTDTLDRALNVLVGIGALTGKHLYRGAQPLTSVYHVRTSRPGCIKPPSPTGRGGRKVAAIRDKPAEIAADSGPSPQQLTESTIFSSHARGQRKATPAAVEPAVGGHEKLPRDGHEVARWRT